MAYVRGYTTKSGKRVKGHNRVKSAARRGSRIAQASRLGRLRAGLLKSLKRHGHNSPRSKLFFKVAGQHDKAMSGVKRKRVKGQYISRGSYFIDGPKKYSKKYATKRTGRS